MKDNEGRDKARPKRTESWTKRQKSGKLDCGEKRLTRSMGSTTRRYQYQMFNLQTLEHQARASTIQFHIPWFVQQFEWFTEQSTCSIYKAISYLFSIAMETSSSRKNTAVSLWKAVPRERWSSGPREANVRVLTGSRRESGLRNLLSEKCSDGTPEGGRVGGTEGGSTDIHATLSSAVSGWTNSFAGKVNN